MAERAGNDARVVFETHDGASVDEVKVHGAPIRVPYGQTLEIRRRATVRP